MAKTKAPPPSTDFLPTSLTEPKLPLPAMIVFDLDYTLWPFWVDTHVTPPLKAAGAFAATDRAGESFALYREVPSVLYALARAGVRLAVASRTSAPELARDMLKLLHVPAPPPPPSAVSQVQQVRAGRSSGRGSGRGGGGAGGAGGSGLDADDEMFWEKPRRAIDLFNAPLEIYPRSKVEHFEVLAKQTGIKHEDMLFFDDESRNREVESLGVTMKLVRDGVTWDEIEKGVNMWRRRRGYSVEDGVE
ncbi:hypothetical protein BROUX41_001159 [Berkeleyomyces rouxiae]|uniref:uncharacterized protein n=1 Tax=Berkeleyomyces rouxiae TaxID=2035830 RepID=UPI003B787E31